MSDDAARQQLKNLMRKTPRATAGFDPGEHTVAEVEEYLSANPGETDAVLAAERAGKNRTTLTGD
jgi:hypothetical protein